MKRISLVGVRGLGNYGGFESFAVGLVPRLAQLGYQVKVSSEDSSSKQVPGAQLDYFPIRPPGNPRLRILFEPIYDAYFILKGGYDIVFGVGCLGGILYMVPRLFGRTSVVNPAGLEWFRGRYRGPERLMIRLLWVACTISANKVALDNLQLVQYMHPKLRSKAVFAPYAIEEKPPKQPSQFQRETALPWKSYWMHMARIEPDNKVLESIQALAKASSKRRLLVLGAFTMSGYRREILSTIRELGLVGRVVFQRPFYDDPVRLDELRAGAFGYIHGHSVGGTAPSLLEAMELEVPVLAFDSRFNREVGGSTLLYYKDSEELAARMTSLELFPVGGANRAAAAKLKVTHDYKWSSVIAKYDELFSQLGARR